jgi:hypothetical protein
MTTFTRRAGSLARLGKLVLLASPASKSVHICICIHVAAQAFMRVDMRCSRAVTFCCRCCKS